MVRRGLRERRVLAPKRLPSASNNSAPNTKDACCGLSAYELQRLTEHSGEGSLLSSLMLLQAAEDLRQTIKPKPDVKRSNASLDKVQSLLSSRKSLRLKEAQNLSLRVGRTYEHDIECSEAEADVAGTTMAIYTVQAEGDDHDGPGGLFCRCRLPEDPDDLESSKPSAKVRALKLKLLR
ncbi:unnamed protein product [Pleuronectes platessa]|uniref:Uncharacterized protein n=1 Tax=Pleuronectes platessa TaxID=8262 RepID=A0A9N7TRI1_PLEPL|nr:unnamed protein product [Pleuronectes platessa]